MFLRQANTDCRRLCRQYGIKPVQVVPLRFTTPHKYEPPFIARDKSKWLGHWDNLHRCVEVNRATIHLWTRKEIEETLQHELMHGLCHMKYLDYDGDHDDRFFAMCKEHGLNDYVARAYK